MKTKMLVMGAALTSLAFAGATFAQNARDTDGIPDSSPTSPSTVNPMPERDWQGAPAVTEKSTVQSQTQTQAQADADQQARTPISTDVAAQLGVPVEITASAPVPDTKANRAKYGGPMSHAGRLTKPAGN